MPYRIQMFAEHKNGDTFCPYQCELDVEEQAQRYYDSLQEIAQQSVSNDVTCRIYYVEVANVCGDEVDEIDAKGVEIFLNDNQVRIVSIGEQSYEYS